MPAHHLSIPLLPKLTHCVVHRGADGGSPNTAVQCVQQGVAALVDKLSRHHVAKQLQVAGMHDGERGEARVCCIKQRHAPQCRPSRLDLTGQERWPACWLHAGIFSQQHHPLRLRLECALSFQRKFVPHPADWSGTVALSALGCKLAAAKHAHRCLHAWQEAVACLLCEIYQWIITVQAQDDRKSRGWGAIGGTAAQAGSQQSQAFKAVRGAGAPL